VIRDRVLIDTGPLVAILAADDAQHNLCVEQSRQLRRPFLTTWPIVTEAAWLLREIGKSDAIPRVLGLVEQNLIQCIGLGPSASPTIAELARKYQDLRPDFPDLTLIYSAAKHNLLTIFTLDRRDFVVYRDPKGRPFRLLP
jgi:predicted nucleic acid-binding protein